jgi:uncharacterized membrane protein YagU involved in acid resistance
MRYSPIAAILLGGFVAGTIDIGSACLINGLSPVVILHAIASGALGKASYAGGLGTAGLGLLLQWAMSLIIAAIFVFAARLLPFLSRLWLASGLAYGVAIFVVMSFVVVPLSNAYPKPHGMPPPANIVENLLAMLLFGIIVAWFARDATPDARR